MNTNRILIAISFPIFFAGCAMNNSGSNISPITRCDRAVRARVHPSPWHASSDSWKKIAEHWEAVVEQDLKIAEHSANRPDQIEDSTVIELTGEHVKSDNLPDVFARNMARLDIAENSQENYMIDFCRQFSSEPDSWANKPITKHAAVRHTAEIEALRTALLLHRQVLTMINSWQ